MHYLHNHRKYMRNKNINLMTQEGMWLNSFLTFFEGYTV